MILRQPRHTLFPSTLFFLFFFNDTATTEIYTLSLHDALPILLIEAFASSPTLRWISGDAAAPHLERLSPPLTRFMPDPPFSSDQPVGAHLDRKSTRLNSSH